MDSEKMEKLSEVGKNISETVKNFYEVINAILQPRGINAALVNAHTQIIASYMNDSELSLDDKLKLVSSYKRTVKEYDRCAKTAKIASELISEDAHPEKVEEDWFNFFFDKVRLVSDETVQNMWAQILAEEVNKPGKISRALLHTLSIMSNAQAKLFCNIAKFCMYEYKNADSVYPFIFMSASPEMYEKVNINHRGLRELEYLGLIQCDFKDEYVFETEKQFCSGNNIIEITGNPENNGKIRIGNVIFTPDGLALYNIVGDSYKRYRSEYLESIITKLQHRKCTVKKNGKFIE